MSARDQRWLDYLEQVRAYVAHHQRPPLSNQKPLGEWLSYQRGVYRRGQMRPDRSALLTAEHWWTPGRHRSIDVTADKLQPDYLPGYPDTVDAEFSATVSPINLRDTWTPNRNGVAVCIWCTMPASLCVINHPCESRKEFELRTACHCNALLT